MPLPRLSALFLAATALSAAKASAVDLVRQAGALELALLATLPANPAADPGEALCSVLGDAPITAAGQLVASAGWKVTGELEMGALILVSFVGRVEQGTSGSCLLGDGNVGIFQDGALQGLIYAPEGSELGIGSMQPLEGDRIRIWDGDYLSQPLADLQIVGGDLVILTQVASRDSFCEGAVTVPNIYGLPLHLARRMLLAEGWTPAAISDPPTMGWTAEMRRDWPELEDCSGTGFGYCSWSYAKIADEGLSVTTAGEAPEGSSPTVIDFGATCGG